MHPPQLLLHLSTLQTIRPNCFLIYIGYLLKQFISLLALILQFGRQSYVIETLRTGSMLDAKLELAEIERLVKGSAGLDEPPSFEIKNAK